MERKKSKKEIGEVKKIESDGSLEVQILKTFSLSKSEQDALKMIMEVPCENGTKTGWWQFRDGRQKEFDRSGRIRWEDCDHLLNMGILHDDDMDWNLGYYITKLGRELYEKIK